MIKSLNAVWKWFSKRMTFTEHYSFGIRWNYCWCCNATAFSYWQSRVGASWTGKTLPLGLTSQIRSSSGLATSNSDTPRWPQEWDRTHQIGERGNESINWAGSYKLAHRSNWNDYILCLVIQNCVFSKWGQTGLSVYTLVGRGVLKSITRRLQGGRRRAERWDAAE